MTPAVTSARLGIPDVASVVLGQSPPSSSYNHAGEGLPFFQGKVDFQRLHPSPRVWCTQGRKFATYGDILISVRAPVGDVNFATEKCVIGRGVAAIRPGPLSDPWFLYFALLHTKPILESRATGSTFASVNRTTLNDLEIPFFGKEKQVEIGVFLRSLVNQIEQEDEALRVSQELKRAAMRTLFTRGLRGEAQKETEIGPAPEGWELKPIGEFARQLQYGLSVRGAESGRYPILRMNCQQDGKVLFRELQYVDIDCETAATYRVKPNDLLFNRTNSYELVGRTAIVEQVTDAVFASYLVRVAVDETRLSPQFLNYFLNWDSAQSELRKLASRGVSQANISAGKLRGFVVPVPSLDEQREIVAILDAIDRKIDLHRRKRAVLEELFKALLHRLMTGETRVGELGLSESLRRPNSNDNY